jgi:hypothetical protein
VYGITAELDHHHELEKAKRETLKLVVQARVAQLSGIQTVGGALREELRLARVDNFTGQP